MLSEAAGAESGDATLLGASCPIPITNYTEIVLAHGSGGKLSHQLMEKMVLPQFRNELLEPLHDGAIFSFGDQRLAFSTDSYVVSPIFFPGGDIGALARALPVDLFQALTGQHDLFRITHSATPPPD